MKYELIPTVILPTSAEVGNIINQLKSEFSKFDADTLSASLMVQTLHKRLCTAIKCSVEVKPTVDIIDGKANVYAPAILNDLEPPRHLQKSDSTKVKEAKEGGNAR
ncbi:hypothetical protein [Xenorhabdus budapestensis]|uniref:Uncharacterized protein n=1 Tax=Xenorhabdus budapestensis TaxID=290110 RepID=A0A2D0IJE5_XENBU|nr:hypothetical protein [Xenorhabdus budapestensis]PHM21890.1 hypothetical protein Xbud_03857 [Xenorhabdus budapestensis]